MKFDLHSHSSYSYDGYTTYNEYLNYDGNIDVLAITDHNNFDFHYRYQKSNDGKAYRVGKLIIIPGEEIMTCDAGEIVGLFLKESISSGLTLKNTILQIKSQGGIVYIPHPFDLYRRKSRPNIKAVKKFINEVDIIEIENGKYLTRFESLIARRFATSNKKMCGAGSDAHKISEVGQVFLEMKYNEEVITKDDLIKLLEHKYSVHTKKKSIILRVIKKLKKMVNNGTNSNFK
ncbi:PHP domain-containing protein [Acidaminobacter sp. JC074]|uniref:PHP domain-containing protein n=1 Tax=Acidaminobacter sp. JC074 TaxID=2530199 RepID=UPI001F0D6AC4|nr:PHP domain-containing protein [Acidaminobacter sp. JC074]